MRAHRGFTLLETLVALAIVAAALVAALRAMGATALSVGDLRTRMVADWVAHDRIARHRAGGQFPAVGRAEGRVRQGRQDFVWQESVGGTPNPLFRRIEVVVMPAGSDQVLARATGFVSRPLR